MVILSADLQPEIICPKGWKMATSGRDADKVPILEKDSFAAMLNKYGYNFTYPDHYGNYAPNPNDNGQDVLLQPFHGTIPGRVRLDTGYLWNTNKESDIWSATTVDGPYPTVLQFYINRVQPSSHGMKSWGYSLRYCANHYRTLVL